MALDTENYNVGGNDALCSCFQFLLLFFWLLEDFLRDILCRIAKSRVLLVN